MTKPRYPEYIRLEARRLRTDGLTSRAIAQRLDVADSTVRRWLNPDEARRSRRTSREAKQRRLGTCEDCGAETRYNGHTERGPSRLCLACANKRNAVARTIWTRERILDAIRWWADLHGRQPAVIDFSPTSAVYRGDYERAIQAECHFAAQDIPWFNTVIRVFGSWNAAIAAAGLTPLAPHGGNGNSARRRKRFA